MLQLSVIVCSHNPKPTYLARTLHSLQAQTLERSRWELLLIDNRSGSPLSDSWRLDWHPNGRHVREEQLGLTPARVRGIAEARGDLLAFIDDDNVLAADYLQRAVELHQRFLNLGAFGAGTLEPEFEVPPPPQLASRLSMLALRVVQAPIQTNSWADKHCIPWGAGLCVTRTVAMSYAELVKHLSVTLLDRCGNRLFCGGDDLFSRVASDAGLSFGIFPELRITHLISAVRLTEDYFVRLIHDHAYSHSILNYRLSGELTDVRRVTERFRSLLHGIRRGRFSMQCRNAEREGIAAAHRAIREMNLRPRGGPAPGAGSAGRTAEPLPSPHRVSTS